MSKPRPMTESEAWLILAEEHEAERTYSSFLCLNLGDRGAAHNRSIRAIPKNLRTLMVDRINDALGDVSVAYPASLDAAPGEKRAGRVTACLLFAAIAA